MLKANISKKNTQQVICAAGDIPELMNDMAILVSGIYTQLRNADPAAAVMFRNGMVRMLADVNGPAWKPADGQTGIIIQKPKKEEE